MHIRIGATQSDSLPNPPRVDNEDLKKTMRELSQLSREMPNVAVRVLNASMKGIKTDMKKVIRDKYTIKAGDLNKRLRHSQATRANLIGFVESRGQGMHVTDIPGTTQIKKGISLNLRKDTGRQVIPRAFIQEGRNSGKLIGLRRPGNPRGQIDNLYPRYGPPGSAGKMGKSVKAALDTFYIADPETLYNAPENWVKIVDYAKKRIDTNIEREIDAEFRRLEGKW